MTRAASQKELRLGVAELTSMSTEVPRAMGAPSPTAKLVAESLLLSNLVGRDSHDIHLWRRPRRLY